MPHCTWAPQLTSICCNQGKFEKAAMEPPNRPSMNPLRNPFGLLGRLLPDINLPIFWLIGVRMPSRSSDSMPAAG